MKLSNPEASSEVYWSFLKSFVRDKNTFIPRLYRNGDFITNSHQKTGLLTFFFAQQCSILQNSKALQTNLDPPTDQSLTSVNFSQDDILKIIPNLTQINGMVQTK